MIELLLAGFPSINVEHMKLIYIDKTATAAECRKLAEERGYAGYQWVRSNRKCYGYEEDRR